uniref:Uncharacterized protein n=1 Tax=Alexandrium catenella TaxID=2925 RepID=A0A7S1L2F2_ALECA
MRPGRFAPLTLALLSVQAVGHRSSGLRAVRSVQAASKASSSAAALRGDSVAACSCDCCLTQLEALVPGAASAVACAPRAGAGVASGAAGIGDGGCGRLCQVPESERNAFESVLGEVDYTRYCPARCRPVTATLGLLCVGSLGGTSGPLTLVAASGSPRSARALPQLKQKTEASKEGAAVVTLARGEMEQALAEAKAAGKAAYLARDSYERVLASSRAEAKAAAQKTLAKLRLRARKQAWDAQRLRERYEERMQKRAKKAALGAAMVYKRAKARNLQLAKAWKKRARQFEEVAKEREDTAAREAKLAQASRRSKASNMESQYRLAAQQALDEAEAYEESAEMASAQAKNISAAGKWYDQAGRYAAARAMVAALPPGVPPPALPPM